MCLLESLLIWGCSSSGRAFGSQSKGSRFKSGQLQTIIEEPLKNERGSGHFRFNEKTSLSEIYRANF